MTCACSPFHACETARQLQAAANTTSPTADGLSLYLERVRAFLAHREAAGLGRQAHGLTGREPANKGKGKR